MNVAPLAALFREGRTQYEIAPHRDLNGYPEHRNPRLQAEIVQMFRVAVRRNVSLAIAQAARGRPGPAAHRAFHAGRQYGEYRRHLRQLKMIGGIK